MAPRVRSVCEALVIKTATPVMRISTGDVRLDPSHDSVPQVSADQRHFQLFEAQALGLNALTSLRELP